MVGLNPLKSGPTFGYYENIQYGRRSFYVSIPSNRVLPSVRRRLEAGGWTVWVSIPSNRVLPSVRRLRVVDELDLLGLNPLKSGPTFGFILLYPCGYLNLVWSQSPQIGSYLRF